ncbi:uncharacterized protein LOC129586455 [Paramacrobiotus metropolitanus]|uniref:uncharacterized protein LOC129586455 n=1 Tax=Paramacrobiotus metropolitanus TaxID=2943436 RepID=UPI0024456EFA|nr:uncharacterized protein LOC129586455 [Paramacrobiotus metropolitanus]
MPRQAPEFDFEWTSEEDLLRFLAQPHINAELQEYGFIMLRVILPEGGVVEEILRNPAVFRTMFREKNSIIAYQHVVTSNGCIEETIDRETKAVQYMWDVRASAAVDLPHEEDRPFILTEEGRRLFPLPIAAEKFFAQHFHKADAGESHRRAFYCISTKNIMDHYKKGYNMADFSCVLRKYSEDMLTGPMGGISTYFTYISARGSVSALHIEDADMVSINYCVFCADPNLLKLWFGWPPHALPLLRQLGLEEHLKQYPDSNATPEEFVNARDKQQFMDPAAVEKAIGVPATYAFQREGYMIVTAPRAPHEVINLGEHFANGRSITRR